MSQYEHFFLKVILAGIILRMEVSCGLNLGLISGDLRRLSNPLLIKKTLPHSPVTINIKSSNLPSTITPKLNTLKIPRLSYLPILPIIPPIIPKLPLLPPLLPVIPPLPLLPILPHLPKTLKAPNLHLKKSLDKQVKSAIKPPPNIRKNISKILWDLKKIGSLTTPEYLRFKKLLL